MLSVMQGKARQLVDVLDSNLTPSDETEGKQATPLSSYFEITLMRIIVYFSGVTRVENCA